MSLQTLHGICLHKNDIDHINSDTATHRRKFCFVAVVPAQEKSSGLFLKSTVMLT